MIQFTCKDHPGLPQGHDDCDGDGVSWSTVELKSDLADGYGMLSVECENPDADDIALDGFFHDAILAHHMKAAIADIEEDHGAFLAYIDDELGKFKCMHATPKGSMPMMWPETIACIVKRAKLDAVEQYTSALKAMLALHRIGGPLEIIEFGPGGTGEETEAHQEIDAAKEQAAKLLGMIQVSSTD